MFSIIQADLTNPQHAEAEIALLDAYARDPMGGGKGLADNVKRELCAQLVRRDAVVLLAFEDETPVGLTNAFETFSTFRCKPILNIHDIAVLPAYRGKGIASAMLAKMQEIAVERGCCKLTLEVLENNAPARAAYDKFGFRGYELGPAAGKALFMEKLL